MSHDGRTVATWPLRPDMARFRRATVAVGLDGLVWVAAGRSVERFDPSTGQVARVGLPAELSPLPANPDNGGVVAAAPRGSGLDVVLYGQPDLLRLEPSPNGFRWGRVATLPLIGYDFSRVLRQPSGTELVSGVVPRKGADAVPVVARVRPGSAPTLLPETSGCVAGPATSGACVSPVGTVDWADGRSSRSSAVVGDVRLSTAAASASGVWTWEGAGPAAQVRYTDLRDGGQLSFGFPLARVKVGSTPLTSGAGLAGRRRLRPGDTVTVDPGTVSLVAVGSTVWLLTHFGRPQVTGGPTRSVYSSVYTATNR